MHVHNMHVYSTDEIIFYFQEPPFLKARIVVPITIITSSRQKLLQLFFCNSEEEEKKEKKLRATHKLHSFTYNWSNLPQTFCDTWVWLQNKDLKWGKKYLYLSLIIANEISILFVVIQQIFRIFFCLITRKKVFL